jgi:hypothetical protein
MLHRSNAYLQEKRKKKTLNNFSDNQKDQVKINSHIPQSANPFSHNINDIRLFERNIRTQVI